LESINTTLCGCSIVCVGQGWFVDRCDRTIPPRGRRCNWQRKSTVAPLQIMRTFAIIRRITMSGPLLNCATVRCSRFLVVKRPNQSTPTVNPENSKPFRPFRFSGVFLSMAFQHVCFTTNHDVTAASKLCNSSLLTLSCCKASESVDTNCES
jgi:hypothetical protein